MRASRTTRAASAAAARATSGGVSPDDQLLTAQELAQYLKLDEMTIYNWAASGTLPAHRLLKHWRFRKREIDRWLDLVWSPSLLPEPRYGKKLTLYDRDANRVVSRAVADQHMSRQAKAVRTYLSETTALNQLIAKMATRGWKLERMLEKIGIEDSWVRERIKEFFSNVGELVSPPEKRKG